MRILGFDEAGRGCVLGPMVVGGYMLTEDMAKTVREAGGRDSKGMSATRREAIVPELEALAVQWRTVALSPTAIDAGNLNELEEQTFARIAAELAPDRVQIDAPVPPSGLGRFQRKMAALMHMPVDHVEVANQAEDRFPAVGAASVLAKVERDSAIAALRDDFGDIGSGYPSDPKTRRFLTQLLEDGEPLPPVVRTRWDTIRRIREEIAIRRRQRTLF
jgi:ribonuclease HII